MDCTDPIANVIRAGPTPDHSFGRLPTTSIHPTPDLLRNALALDPSQIESLVCEPDKSLPARPSSEGGEATELGEASQPHRPLGLAHSRGSGSRCHGAGKTAGVDCSSLMCNHRRPRRNSPFVSVSPSST